MSTRELATKDSPFLCYIGYDSHEDIAFQVAKFSLKSNSSVPLRVMPLNRSDLRDQGIYTREQDPKQSTEFTYCRFFVPYLSNFKGWALFADDDFLWLGDVAELIDLVDDKYAVMCVKHCCSSTANTKLAGRQQESYPRKNWSSMVLYNCGHPANANLTLDVINSEPGSFLHRFSWISEESLIGEINYEWNFLVGWYEVYPDARMPKAIHFTDGGPWFPDYRKTDYSDIWFEYLRAYEATLMEPRMLCPFERFTEKGSDFLEGYSNSTEPWFWEHERA